MKKAHTPMLDKIEQLFWAGKSAAEIAGIMNIQRRTIDKVIINFVLGKWCETKLIK